MMNGKLCIVSMCICVLLFCVLATCGQKSNQPHQNQSLPTNDIVTLQGEERVADTGVSVDEPVAVSTYCDSLLNYIEEELDSEYPIITVSDENGNNRYQITEYSNNGLFLMMIQLPFGPEKDTAYICTKKILGIFDYELPINQIRSNQIKWLIKNSSYGRHGKFPSDWITDFDTTFQPYCSVFPSSVFLELGLDQTKWGRAYYPPAGYCENHEKCPEENFRFEERGSSVIFCYFAHNHLQSIQVLPPQVKQRLNVDESMMIKIPISENLTLYQTGHGVLLRKDNMYRWVYHSDQMERLRWRSINNVTVTNGQINVFLENKTKPLSFLLKDLL